MAVKLVRSGLQGYEMVQRFRLERQILARLEHPNIAALLDGGVTEDGLPYLVMQYVHGVPITEYADTHRLPVRERLQIFGTICRAVQYAHANFVVHRDLKPSNILVTVDGQVRLLDFGIAKLLDPEGTPSGVVPTRSLLLLTPEHAAPEQFLGQAITTATDVYQLGVLLYEMLAGTRPFQASTSHALHRAICDEEPTRPSAALGMPGAGQIEPADTVAEADAARARSTTPDSLRHQLRGDLDRIVLMALRKEPGRRYVSAADLADDIERHLGGYPVRARPESLAYVGGRFVRRHKAAVAAAVALAASLIALAVTSIRFAATTSAQAAAIAEERDVALEVSSFLEDMFAASDPFAAGPERRDTLRIRAFLDEGARNVRDELDGQPIVQARLFTILGRAYRNLGQFDEARPLLDEALTIRTREAGPESADVATSQLDLAQLLIDRGDHDQAEALLRSSLTILGRDSAKNVRRVASTFGILGNVLQEGGRYAEAEAAYRQALVLAETDSITDDGRRAEALFRESLDMRRALYGEQHPAVGIGWINLAAVLQRDQGRHEEAMKSYDEARTVLVATVGPRHPLLGAIDGNLGRLHHGNGEHDRAITHLRAALGVRRDTYDASHPLVLGTLSDIGRCLTELTRYREAESALLDVYTGLEPQRAGQARLWDSVLVRLVRLYQAMDRDDEAAKHEAMRTLPAS